MLARVFVDNFQILNKIDKNINWWWKWQMVEYINNLEIPLSGSVE